MIWALSDWAVDVVTFCDEAERVVILHGKDDKSKAKLVVNG